jgi:hypothetical protein
MIETFCRDILGINKEVHPGIFSLWMETIKRWEDYKKSVSKE